VGEHFQWFAQGPLAGNLDLMNGGLSLSPLLAAGFLFKFDVPPNVSPASHRALVADFADLTVNILLSDKFRKN
jgi:hypothetical protein